MRDKRPPIFKIALKNISHRFQVIKVKFSDTIISKLRVFLLLSAENFIFFMIKLKILDAFAYTSCGIVNKIREEYE